MSDNYRPNIASFLTSFGAALLIFGAVSSVTWFWMPEKTFHLIPSGTYAAVAAIILALAGIIISGFRLSKLLANPFGFATAIALVFFSDWMCPDYAFFQAPTIRGEIIIAAILSAFIIKKKLFHFLTVIPLIAIAAILYNFFAQSAGRPLISDDHSTFFYRLVLLKENFPFIPFYYPFWNGGIDARAFFATGSLNVFFIGSPFLYFFEPERAYNMIVMTILFILTPASVWLAARLTEPSKFVARIAALLSFSTSIFWYKWGLSYGTLGFTTSNALIPLNLVITCLIVSKDRQLSSRLALLFFFSTNLMLFWSMSVAAFVPVILLCLLFLKRVLKKRFLPLLLILFFMSNLPWVTLFWKASNVGSFVSAEKQTEHTHSNIVLSDKDHDHKDFENKSSEDKDFASKEKKLNAHRYKHKASKIDLNKSLSIFREFSNSLNPLILFLGIPGMFLMRKRFRLPFILTSGWLFLLGCLLVPLKPQLELDRMLVIMSMCWCIPTATAIQKLFSTARNSKNWLAVFLAALCGGFLLTGPLSSIAIVKNRSLTQHHYLGQNEREIIDVIKNNAGDGRTLFSGCVTHEFNHGHIAPLSYYTGKPLIASSQVHNIWWYTQVFPMEFLKEKKSGGIEKYLELQNVSIIFAHEKEWKRYFSKYPDKYEEIWESDFDWSSGPLRLYRVKHFTSDYILKGKGIIEEINSSAVKLTPESSEMVLKFNYFPFLQSSSCRISGEKVSESLEFIKLSDCKTGEEVIIKSVNPIERATS